MIFTLTIQGGETDLAKMQKAMNAFGEGSLMLKADFKPNGAAQQGQTNGAAALHTAGNGADVEDEADQATAGKKVRAPRAAKVAAPAPEPEPEEDGEVTDESLLGAVKAFCAKHPKLNPNVTALLREYGAERVTQVAAPMRTEFLSQLQSLSIAT